MGAHHYGITIGSKNRENLCLKDPLMPKVVQSIPLSASSTQHIGAIGWELWQFSQDMRGRVGSLVGVCVPLALSLSFESSEPNFSTA